MQENVEKDLFEDLARVLKTIKSSPKFQSAKRSPSVLELLSLEAKDVGSVWERFQFSITKAEMYRRDSPDIQPVLDSMRSLPIVGKIGSVDKKGQKAFKFIETRDDNKFTRL